MTKMTIPALAIRNAGRNHWRSLAVILILAIGIFIIVLTGAYRKTYYGSENIAQSGTGGYQLWAETSVPLPFDLNSPAGRKNLVYENESYLDSVHFIQFHSLEGDDASCLNLNQVKKPRILGISPDEFDRKQAFSFVNLAKGTSHDHPWKQLGNSNGNNIFSAFADQTVIQYGLKKSAGDTLSYVNEAGRIFGLRLAGALDNSIFQGNILVSDSILLSQYPSAGGTRFMLVNMPAGKQKQVAAILKNSLKDYGIEITPASARLAEFNSVENIYLTVFIILGGLGLVIGTLGLGIVLLRNMLERRHELALLQALGYRRRRIMLLVVFEYYFLLLSGMACGVVSAFIAIFPSLVSPAFTVQGGFLGMLLLLILISGAMWIYIPAWLALRAPLIPALRND